MVDPKANIFSQVTSHRKPLKGFSVSFNCENSSNKVLENFLCHNFFPFVVETVSVESDIKCYTPSCRLWKVETFKRTRRRYIHKSSIRKKWKVRNVNQTQHKFDKVTHDTAKRKLERLQFSTSSSFVKI